MRVPFVITALLLVINQYTYSQSAGCMDPAAPNYDPSATSSNGSCEYAASNASLLSKGQLNQDLTEISGMTLIGSKLYGHNDSGPGVRNVIYEIDTITRAITKTITLSGAINIDWEDITNDGTYVYVGDFGNNANGNRTDLKFYRFPIAAMSAIVGTTGTIQPSEIKEITFRYEDQPQNPASTGVNNTAYDCEAVLYHNGYLYIFTKNWVGENTVQYRIPAAPGNHIAEKQGSFNTGGLLITSATKANNNTVLLLGYNNQTAACGIWVISGFSDMDHLFETGNKKNINIGSAAFNGQVEAIEAVNQSWALIANERFQRSVFDVPPRLYGLALQPFIPQYVLPIGIENFTARMDENTVFLNWVYGTPAEVKEFIIERSGDANGSYNVIGNIYASANNDSYQFIHQDLEISGNVYYRIKIISLDGTIRYSKILPLKIDGSGQFNLFAMPSPFNSKVDISFYSDTQQIVQLTVVDLSGRMLRSQKIQAAKGQHTLSMGGLSNLSSGVYFLQARTDRQTFVRKIMKQ